MTLSDHIHHWVMFSSQIFNKCFVADFQKSSFLELCNSLSSQKHRSHLAGQGSPLILVHADSASIPVPRFSFKMHVECYFWNLEQTFKSGNCERLSDLQQMYQHFSLFIIFPALSLYPSLLPSPSLYHFIFSESSSWLRHCQLLYKTLYGSHMYLSPSAPD